MVQGADALHTPWTLYYHNPEDKNWTSDSYTPVGSFNTIAGFWRLHAAIPPSCFQFGMFFLMRKDIQPTWEDSRNRNGGCWSYKIPLAQVPTIWRDMAVQLIAENLCTEDELVNGISISPKKGFCVVKIWNRNSQRSSTTLLHPSTPALNHADSLYIPFKQKR